MNWPSPVDSVSLLGGGTRLSGGEPVRRGDLWHEDRSLRRELIRASIPRLRVCRREPSKSSEQNTQLDCGIAVCMSLQE